MDSGTILIKLSLSTKSFKEVSFPIDSGKISSRLSFTNINSNRV